MAKCLVLLGVDVNEYTVSTVQMKMFVLFARGKKDVKLLAEPYKHIRSEISSVMYIRSDTKGVIKLEIID